jgi:flagellar P-ring protein FlgI
MNKIITLLAVLIAGLLCSESCYGQFLRIRDICRVKGQEENTLHGLGLVVGLNGTGDGDVKTTRALAKMMSLMGNPLSENVGGGALLEELKDSKNVAMVIVTATVPAEGARQGETLNCVVSAIGAKSLEGGQLMMTPLIGPVPGNPRVYAFAQGPISLDNTSIATSATVHNGCRLEESFNNIFILDGVITLVLDKNHASFQTAFDLEDLLNSDKSLSGSSGELRVGKAIDQVNIELQLPEKYKDNPIEFIALVLDMQIVPPKHDARVVIDERNGSIVIGDNVMVGRVAVAHRNLSIETGNGAAVDSFREIDQSDSSTTRLKALVAALNALKAKPDEIMDIIKSLERSGDLYGRLIIQ